MSVVPSFHATRVSNTCRAMSADAPSRAAAGSSVEGIPTAPTRTSYLPDANREEETDDNAARNAAPRASTHPRRARRITFLYEEPDEDANRLLDGRVPRAR